MPKRVVIVVAFLFTLMSSFAQLNNSWIDYGKTYYTFRLAKDTLCRINQPLLATLGLANVNADHFQLWRNGQQVRIFTSVTNAPLGPSDYLEFWGEMNDGKPDAALYNNPDHQLNNRFSLETDTVVYYLTVNTAASNLRYVNTTNAPPGTMTAEPYFMRKYDFFYRRNICRGFANVIGEYIYSAAYDAGEGFSSNDFLPCCDLNQLFTGLNVFSGGPANSVSLRMNVFGNAPNARFVKIRMGNSVVYNEPMDAFNYRKIELNNLPLSLLLSSNNLNIGVKDSSSVSTDRLVVAFMGITYPARFNFANQKFFSFDLPANATGNYLVIDNFNFAGQPPILYDLTEGKRYIGDITSTPGKVKFVLPPSAIAERKFMLASQDATAVCQIAGLQQKNFINLSLTANQADYLIISNPLLYDDGSGNNFVDQYRQYRSSPSGGGFRAKVYDIDELTEQFAFGIKKHPAAIRDFVRYAAANFSTPPKFVFLIGRGVNFRENRLFESNPLTARLNLVPTFGFPASDVLLVSDPGTVVPKVPVGRLGAVNALEVKAYLEKITEYEQAQRTLSPLIQDKAWMKNFMHVVGGRDSVESESFRQYVSEYARVASDTFTGAQADIFVKTSASAVQLANSQRIEQLFEEGLGFIDYFGHSSANTFEFNLSNPYAYNNTGKYPVINVSGCNAGNFYIYDSLRFSGILSLSEKYILAERKGSIGFIADTHFGIPPFLNFFNTSLYTQFCKEMYGQSLGKQLQKVTESLGGNNPTLDFYTRIHLEEICLHGDPALKINTFAKPDYAIEMQQVKVSPNIISVADAYFDVNIQMKNIGKAIGDSVWVTVKRKLPNDSIRMLYNALIPPLHNSASLDLRVPINPFTDKGLNQIMVSIDPLNRIDELYETNNEIVRDAYIFEDEIRPCYPYNYAIVNNRAQQFYASTANPLSGTRQYVMEVDTSGLFNSPFKRTYNASGPGGLIIFNPSGITFSDSTVYYWRVAMVPVGSSDIVWNTSSFIFLSSAGTGFNQSHYYQHLAAEYENITLGADRNFRFKNLQRNLTIRTGLFPYFNYDKINVNLDFDQVEFYGCGYSRLQFYVFDTATLKPWRNRNVSVTNGLYGSAYVCPNTGTPDDTTRAFFEFDYSNAVSRKNAMDFIDAIPSGMYVAVTNLGRQFVNNSFVNAWKSDTATLGSGNSLYHKFKSIGFSKIDSFYKNIPFLYFFRKDLSSFPVTQIVGRGDSSYIDQTFSLQSTFTEGSFLSPTFGPARSWNALHWRDTTYDPQPPADAYQLDIYGIKNNGSKELLRSVYNDRDTSLSFIDASVYPRLQIAVISKDTRYVTPRQLSYLRLDADFIPEGAVAPNLLFVMPDSVDQGQPLNFALAFRNVSAVDFDSMMTFSFKVIDKDNDSRVFNLPKGKVLRSGDTLVMHYSLDTRDLPGINTLFAEVNPGEDQAEAYHFNNILFKEFFVRPDNYNPLLDVTFDGVHILNRDIVSAKPQILIRLRDESRYLALSDTSVLKVQVRFPGEQDSREYHFGGDTMRFVPANLDAGDNTATLAFNPTFTADGEYELMVSGKDAIGNRAGDLSYRVTFNVINKPMISNMMNYPNPFTTSTAFVFTITGREVPQNIRIQILTITGKVVKEITSAELGPVHIGNNITDYKWDGTDMYGQKLANGVYLYRVLTNLNGNRLDTFSGRNANGDVIINGLSNTDRFFNKGYGKMYLMR